MTEYVTIGNLMQMKSDSAEVSNMRNTSHNYSLTPQAQTCIAQYQTSNNFLKLFDPSKQFAYTKDLQRVFMGNAPELGTISRAFGENVTIAWLECQLVDLSEYAGCREKLTTFQLDSLAKTILSTWGYYKVTEMMYFFTQFKSGKYGRFYGVIDSMMITEALRRFDKERIQAIDFYTKCEEERRIKEQEEAAAVARTAFNEHLKRCYMTFTEYFDLSHRYDLSAEDMEMIGWLYNMGYEPARLAKERSDDAIRRAHNAKRKAELDAMIAELQKQRAALDD